MIEQYTPGTWQHYVRYAEQSVFAIILPANYWFKKQVESLWGTRYMQVGLSGQLTEVLH